MNNCKNCGAQLNVGDQFCKNCGSSVNESITINNNVNNINNCKNCGAQLNVGDQFCKYCGSSINGSTVNNYSNVNNNQPGWQNGYNQQPVNKQNNTGNGKYITIGIVVVAIFFAIAIAADVVLNVVKSIDVVSDAETISSTYDVSYDNFTFKIPEDLVGEVNSNYLLIKDEDVTWLAEINTLSVSFSSIKSNSKEVLSGLESKGWATSNFSDKTYNGVDIISFNGTIEGRNYIVLYANTDSTNTLYGVIYNLENTFDYDNFNTIVSIITTATYSEKRTNSGSSDTSFDDLANLNI